MTVPQAAALPWQLPKPQADWERFLNTLNSWQPGAPLWNALTLQNSWVAFGAPYSGPQYQVDNYGRLYCRGVVKSGTVTDGTVVTVIPFAPPIQIEVMMCGAFSGAANAPVYYGIDTSGNLRVFGISSFSGSYNIVLDQITYSLAA